MTPVACWEARFGHSSNNLTCGGDNNYYYYRDSTGNSLGFRCCAP